LRLVFISDAHLRHAFAVPDGDVLVHCGDFTMTGTGPEIARFDEWLAKQPHRHKVVIAGNHELGFEDDPEGAQSLLKTPIYLQDAATTIEGVRVYGSPWQPWFHDWAFNFRPGLAGRAQAEETWLKIPDNVDVLVTHGPPYGILDRLTDRSHVGCRDLLAVVKRVKPKIHAFGHIHSAYGTLRRSGTQFVNACICDEDYMPTQPPIVVDLD
jgi:Icc-related predicted phosphoesterase